MQRLLIISWGRADPWTVRRSTARQDSEVWQWVLERSFSSVALGYIRYAFPMYSVWAEGKELTTGWDAFLLMLAFAMPRAYARTRPPPAQAADSPSSRGPAPAGHHVTDRGRVTNDRPAGELGLSLDAPEPRAQLPKILALFILGCRFKTAIPRLTNSM